MTDGQTDRQTDESDFTERCPTNVERTIVYTEMKYLENCPIIDNEYIQQQKLVIRLVFISKLRCCSFRKTKHLSASDSLTL